MSSSKLIRVMIVDDHSILRVGLKEVLEASGEYAVVGQAANGDAAIRLAAAVTPDVVVMDVIMPGMDGVEACREIMAAAPDTRVLMLTASTEEAAVVDAVAAGASGYVQKETGPGAIPFGPARRDAGRTARARRRYSKSARGESRRCKLRRSGARCRAHRKGARDPRCLCPGHVLRRDRRGTRSKAGDRSERRLRHPAQARGWIHAGPGALGRTKRPAGRRCR